MKTYPVNLLLKNKPCLIVGGGKVATRKLRALLNSEANISIIDPKPSNLIKEIAINHNIIIHKREFEESDLNAIFLLYIATNDRAFNAKLLEIAKSHNILTCSVDANWSDGSFITPASVNHNDITIAVSSQGVACRKTKLIKDNLARHIDLIENSDLMVIGTDHNLIDLDKRECIHLPGARMDYAGDLVRTLWGVHEFMLLNTCNRIELIATAHNNEAIIEMLKMILKLNNLDSEQYYMKFGFEAFRHLCLVTSGLLSQTPGENHITAQFKESFGYAKDKTWASTLMTTLNDHILHVSKHIRNNIIPLFKVFEIEELTLAFLKTRCSELKNKNILIIGTGMLGMAIKNIFLKENSNITCLYHSNKPSNKDGNVDFKSFEFLETELSKADIVISALSSEQAIISKEMAHLFSKNIEVIDLASPRNIDSELNSSQNVNLTDMENLKHWHRKNNCDMSVILEKANIIIDEHKDIYENFRKSFIDGRQGE